MQRWNQRLAGVGNERGALAHDWIREQNIAVRRRSPHRELRSIAAQRYCIFVLAHPPVHSGAWIADGVGRRQLTPLQSIRWRPGWRRASIRPRVTWTGVVAAPPQPSHSSTTVFWVPPDQRNLRIQLRSLGDVHQLVVDVDAHGGHAFRATRRGGRYVVRGRAHGSAICRRDYGDAGRIADRDAHRSGGRASAVVPLFDHDVVTSRAPESESCSG